MDNREEQIKHATSEYTKGIIKGGTIRAMDFENGAKWADNNPKFINMETKEIIIPQGWEIDEVRGNKIILMENKKELPKTWEECIAKIKDLEYIDTNGDIEEVDFNVNLVNDHINDIPAGLGEPMLALMQLLVCREVYRQGWKPNWKDDKEIKYCIERVENYITKETYELTATVLAFQSAEIRDEFLENFRDLIEEAKELI